METNSWAIYPGTMALAVIAAKLFGFQNVHSGFSWHDPVIVHDQTKEDINAFVELINERVRGHTFRKFG